MQTYKLLNRTGYPLWSTENKEIFNSSDVITGTSTVGYFAAKFPADWEKIITENDKIVMNVFILFETDIHLTRSSRIFLGVFESKTKAIDAAKENDCYRNDCAVDIVETELNQFNEL